MTSGYPDYVLGDAPSSRQPSWRRPVPAVDAAAAAELRGEQAAAACPGPTGTTPTPTMCCSGWPGKATGRDMPSLLRDEVLDPLGLSRHHQFVHPAVPGRCCTFSSERRPASDPPGTSFCEDGTFWNPCGPSPRRGATTTIHDLEATRRPGVRAAAVAGVLSADGLAGCGAAPAPNPGAPPAARRPTSTPMVWAWCCQATGCCRTRCSVGMPRSRRTCPRKDRRRRRHLRPGRLRRNR